MLMSGTYYKAALKSTNEEMIFGFIVSTDPSACSRVRMSVLYFPSSRVYKVHEDVFDMTLFTDMEAHNMENFRVFNPISSLDDS